MAAGGSPAYDNLLKILLVGDSGVGKSCLVIQFCDAVFPEEMPSTLGVDFKISYMETADDPPRKVKLTIWDTAGQERFRTLSRSYYRGATGVILAYDVTRPETFEGLEHWLSEVEAHSTSSDVVMMLVGNKIDLEGERKVSREQGAAFARAHAMLFIETSARTAEGVRDAFAELVAKILDTPALLSATSVGSTASAKAGTASLTSADGGEEQPTCMGIQC